MAFLVKRSVAMKLSKRLLGSAEALSFARIDAVRWFRVSADAGLFYAHVKRSPIAPAAYIETKEGIGLAAHRRAGIREGGFVEDLDALARLGQFVSEFPVPWRQGIKHDLAPVLELRRTKDGSLVNGLGEEVDVEPDVLVPLYKGSDVAKGRDSDRLFPLYQVTLGGPEPQLERKWPKLASYLGAHLEHFNSRRSRIYVGKHPFALFGVGPYLLAPWKVAISGLARTPIFRVLGPANGRPAVVDDTCYTLAYTDEESAVRVASHLNSPGPQQLIDSLADRRAKRPFTKAVLSRVGVPVVPVDGPDGTQLALSDAA